MRLAPVLLSIGLAVAVANAAGAQTDLMFVTSAQGTGKLSTWPDADGLTGIAAGNRVCQNLAAAAHLANAATFQAWLSDPSTDAGCNIKARGGHPPNCGSLAINNPGPWARTDGAPFARNIGRLTSGEVFSPPLFDENGNHVAIDALAHTGTDENGRLVARGDCEDDTGVGWNSTSSAFPAAFGAAAMGTGTWTYAGSADCSALRHLYCFQHTLLGGAPLHPFEHDGALVFRTSTSYGGNLGLSPDAGGQSGGPAGDAICRRRATAGSLPHPEDFRAWLSTGDDMPVEFLVYGGAFKRPDGIEIAASKVGLLDGELAAPLAETELLAYRASPVWTGTKDDGTRLHFVEETANCDDWSNDEGDNSGGVGFSAAVVGWSYALSVRSCNIPEGLYCISQTPILFWSNFEEGGGNFWRWAATASGG